MSIPDNLRQVKERIAAACDCAGRDPQTVTLIAVTKTVHPDHIKQAYDQGHRHFGENRLQEAIPKIEALPSDITWHYIGKLQSNKAKRAAQYFPVIHTLETEAQLKEIEKQSNQASGLIELNLSSEPQKSGISVKMLDDFHTAVLECNHVRFRGLMTVGPNLEDPEGMRPYFKELRRLGEQVGAEWLSMGMSGDFEVAIQEGATHVRVGSAIFGSRK
jgi:pyridoxal phosphate enzyme (YggS family)